MTIPLLELLENPAKVTTKKNREDLPGKTKFGRLSIPRTRFPSSKERASFSLSPSVFCLFFAQARALCIACNQSHLVPQDFSRRKKNLDKLFFFGINHRQDAEIIIIIIILSKSSFS